VIIEIMPFCIKNMKTTLSSHYLAFLLLGGIVSSSNSSAALINLTNDTQFTTTALGGGAGTAVVDLATYTSINNGVQRGAVVNGALLLQGSVGSGSGNYRRLFQVGANGRETTEDGYNRAVTTNKNGSTFNESISNGFDPLLRLGELLEVNGYYFFALDTNENNNATDKWISLDEIQVYVGGSVDPDTLPNTPSTLGSLGTKVWDLQGEQTDGSHNTIMLNDTLQSGSGTDNMHLLLPTSIFSGFAADSYIYMYVSHGVLGTQDSPTGQVFDGFDISGGFEEWSTFTNTSGNPPEIIDYPIPEPSGAALVIITSIMQLLRRSR